MGSLDHPAGRHRWLVGIVVVLLALLATQPVATAQASALPRVGIVVSVQNYSSVPRLNATHADGDAIEKSMRSLEFEIIVRARDIDQDGLEAALKEAQRQLAGRKPALVFLYYSGHGGVLEERGDSYLFFRDFRPDRPESFKANSIKLSDLISRFDGWDASAVALALDACRFVIPAAIPGSPSVQTAEFKALGRGFVSLPRPAPRIFVSYATSPGSVALDDHFYSSALAREMVKRGNDVSAIFEAVRQDVTEATGKLQIPRNDDQLDSAAWLQPEFPFEMTATYVSETLAPASFFKPRLFVNPGEGGVWLQSGYWGPDHPFQLKAFDTRDQRRWEADLLSANLPDAMVADTLAFSPSRIAVGLHTENGPEWKPAVLFLGKDGSRQAALKLSDLFGSTPARVRRIRMDALGGAWVLVNLGPDKAYAVVRIPPDLKTLELWGSTQSSGALETFIFDDFVVYSAEEMNSKDCLLRPIAKCKGMVLAAGIHQRADLSEEAILWEFTPSGSTPSNTIYFSDKNTELAWIQKRSGSGDCCVVGGVIGSSKQTALFWTETNTLGLLQSGSLVTFDPPGLTGCYSESGAAVIAPATLALASCKHGDRSTPIVLAWDSSGQLLSWAEICPPDLSCHNPQLAAGPDGSAAVAVLVERGNQLVGRIYSVRMKSAKGAPYRN